MTLTAVIGADVFDGRELHIGHALLLEDGLIVGIVPSNDLPDKAHVMKSDPGTLMPDFVDLQVNGGGGVLFNDTTTVDGLRRIIDAHKGTGTRAILPTLITDTPEKTEAAIHAVANAIKDGCDGIVGLHLEGPHLSVVKKGAHDASLIRPMTETDLGLLQDGARRLPNLLVTVAPENVTASQVATLTKSGVIVSLGHSNCSAEQAKTLIAAGARCVTHLFNAMSGLQSREPGLVGAALVSPDVSAGLIADGIHVHPDSIRIALAAKSPDSLFLVTDAMPTVGSEISAFHLNGRRVLRDQGRLTLEDGTLAGADLTLPQAIRVLVEDVGVPLSTALRMATSVPARVLRQANNLGHLTVGATWNGIHLGKDFRVSRLAL